MSCSKSLEFEAIRRVHQYRNLQKYHAAFVGAEYCQFKKYSANKPYKTEEELNKIGSILSSSAFGSRSAAMLCFNCS